MLEDPGSFPGIQTGSGVHPDSYPMGIGGSIPGTWSWPLTSIQCQVKNSWSYTSTPLQYVFAAWCLDKHRENFTFTFTVMSSVTMCWWMKISGCNPRIDKVRPTDTAILQHDE